MFSESIKPECLYYDRNEPPDVDDVFTSAVLSCFYKGTWTVYRGVTVVWDEDHDERVLSFIDKMAEEDREYLAGIYEHEGSIEMVWLYEENPRYKYGTSVNAPGPDSWSIFASHVIGAKSPEIKYDSYADALKSPRWQRKRLEIMKRDNFECQHCGDKESQLHVHHRRYLNNKMPWEYDDIYLITLCDSCHAKQHGRAA